MKIRTVEIEFAEDIFGSDGDIRYSKGDHLYVDQMSAHSLVDVKKVARRVADGPTLSTDRRRPPKRKKAAEPTIPPATTEEGPPDEPADDTDEGDAD